MWPNHYFQLFAKSLQADFYSKKLKKLDFAASLRFFIVSMILSGIVFAALINGRELPKVVNHIDSSLDDLAREYPKELEIIWQSENETLQVETESTIYTQYPAWFLQDLDNKPEYFLAISKQELADDNLDELINPSLIVIDQKQLRISNMQGGYNSIGLAELPGFEEDFSISRENVSLFVERWKTASDNLLDVLGKILFIILPVFIPIQRFLSILVYSFIAFIVYYSDKEKYQKTLQLGLHVGVLAELVVRLSQILYPEGIGFGFFISFFAIFLFIHYGKELSNRKTK